MIFKQKIAQLLRACTLCALLSLASSALKPRFNDVNIKTVLNNGTECCYRGKVVLDTPTQLSPDQFFAPELLWDALKHKLQFYNMEIPVHGAQIFDAVPCTDNAQIGQTIHEADDGKNDNERAAIKVFVDRCRLKGPKTELGVVDKLVDMAINLADVVIQKLKEFFAWVMSFFPCYNFRPGTRSTIAPYLATSLNAPGTTVLNTNTNNVNTATTSSSTTTTSTISTTPASTTTVANDTSGAKH